MGSAGRQPRHPAPWTRLSPAFSCPAPHDRGCSGNCGLSLPESSVQWRPRQRTVRGGAWVRRPSCCEGCAPLCPPPCARPHPGSPPAALVGVGALGGPAKCRLRKVGSQAAGLAGGGESVPGDVPGVRVPLPAGLCAHLGRRPVGAAARGLAAWEPRQPSNSGAPAAPRALWLSSGHAGRVGRGRASQEARPPAHEGRGKAGPGEQCPVRASGWAATRHPWLSRPGLGTAPGLR